MLSKHYRSPKKFDQKKPGRGEPGRYLQDPYLCPFLAKNSETKGRPKKFQRGDPFILIKNRKKPGEQGEQGTPVYFVKKPVPFRKTKLYKGNKDQ